MICANGGGISEIDSAERHDGPCRTTQGRPERLSSSRLQPHDPQTLHQPAAAMWPPSRQHCGGSSRLAEIVLRILDSRHRDGPWRQI